MREERYLGENPKGFPTQRVVLSKEDQQRWVGGIFSHASLGLLWPCDSLVRILCVSAVCM
jgi:hypothetical protein